MVQLGQTMRVETPGDNGVLVVTGVFDGGNVVLAEELEGYGKFEWELCGQVVK